MRAMRCLKISQSGARRARRSCIGMAALSMALAPTIGNAAVDTCKRSSDEKSVYVRSLQTDLMVAALTCSDSQQYNDFIKRFQAVLKTDAGHLQSYFKKRNGKAGAEELNSFVTRLANDESERSIQVGQSDYCDNANKLFQSVLALSPKDIEDFATTLPISSEAPVRACAAAPVAEKPKATDATPVTNGATVETK